MSAFEKAKEFFETLEALKGWDGCKHLVAPGAPFACQSAAMAGIDTVEAYCAWVAAFGTITAPGAAYDLHAAGWDEGTRIATFFATYNATHTGDGGPVAPTGMETHSDYVYAVTMGPDDKVQSMTKIWNDGWALKELGWA